MRTNFESCKYVTGDQAYLIFWISVYDMQIRLSTVIALHENLEVILSDAGDLLGYRFDSPRDLKCFMKDEGEWQFIDDSKFVRRSLIQSLRVLESSQDYLNHSQN